LLINKLSVNSLAQIFDEVIALIGSKFVVCDTLSKINNFGVKMSDSTLVAEGVVEGVVLGLFVV
jgi:hypothetical protein